MLWAIKTRDGFDTDTWKLNNEREVESVNAFTTREDAMRATADLGDELDGAEIVPLVEAVPRIHPIASELATLDAYLHNLQQRLREHFGEADEVVGLLQQLTAGALHNLAEDVEAERREQTQPADERAARTPAAAVEPKPSKGEFSLGTTREEQARALVAQLAIARSILDQFLCAFGCTCTNALDPLPKHHADDISSALCHLSMTGDWLAAQAGYEGAMHVGREPAGASS